MNESPETSSQNDPEVQEASGKSVEEAIELALNLLDARRAEAEVEVLSTGKGGFLGFGAEMARVRVTRLREAGLPAQAAKAVVDRILEGLDVSAISMIGKPSADSPETPLIEITGEDSGLLIGRRGETLRAFQFVVNLLLSRRNDPQIGRVMLDVEQYRQRRNRVLRDLALRVADRVVSSGRPITLEPMSPAERRAIHIALADHPRVQTSSVGEGDQRQVSVLPRGGAGPPSQGSPNRPSPHPRG